MGNMALQVKQISIFPQLVIKSKQRNIVEAVFSVRLQYMHPEKIAVEAHCNRDNMYVIKDMKVFCKEKTRVNRVYQWCTVLCHGNFKGTELYSVERLVKVITEIPNTAYLPINNPLIENPKKK